MELRDPPGNYRPVSLTSLVGKVLKTAAGGVLLGELRFDYGEPGWPCPRNLLKCFEAVVASPTFKGYSGAQNLHILSVPQQPFRDGYRLWPTYSLQAQASKATVKIEKITSG